MDRRLPAVQPSMVSAALVAVLAAGCGPEPEPEPDFIWRGENLDIYLYDVDEDYFCGGTLAHMDDHMGRISAIFAAEFDAKPIARVGQPEFVERFCPPGIGGCVHLDKTTAMRFDRMPLDHELVHVAEMEVSTCPVLLAEGLAEYYSLRHYYQQVEPWNLPSVIEGTLDDPTRLASANYTLAGHFVAFLIETRGLDQFFRVCDRTGWLPTHDEFYEAFESVYGQTVDSLIEDYGSGYPLTNYRVCEQADYARKLVECDQPIVGVLEHGKTLELDFDIDCTNSQTLGPATWNHDELEQVWVNQRIELAPFFIPHRIAVSTSDDQGNPTSATVAIMPCGRCLERVSGISSDLEDGMNGVPWELDEGIYVVSIRVPLADARRIRVTLSSV